MFAARATVENVQGACQTGLVDCPCSALGK